MFPKVWALGTPQCARLLEGPVEITEKIDGSQANLVIKADGFVQFRSKGADILSTPHNNLFEPFLQWARPASEMLGREGKEIILSGETLWRPKHNILAYDHTPKNNFTLFGVCINGTWQSYDVILNMALMLGCDVVPLLFSGPISGPELIEFAHAKLEEESTLGGPKREGIVVKNYAESLLIGGHLVPILCGKYVSEAFKEQHKRDWKSTGNHLEDMILSYCTKARWEKARQHMREAGTLEVALRDIGPLIKMVQEDIEVECKEDIKEHLWTHFKRQFLGASIRGLPQWYKDELLTNLAEPDILDPST